jgi:hypothetical protein
VAVEDAADRATFVDEDDFAVAVAWTRDGVAQTPFSAHFHRPSLMVEGMSAAPLNDRRAWLHCREADLPAGAAEDDPVSVAGESEAYACRAIRPDGTGFAVVDLKKV